MIWTKGPEVEAPRFSGSARRILSGHVCTETGLESGGGGTRFEPEFPT